MLGGACVACARAAAPPWAGGTGRAESALRATPVPRESDHFFTRAGTGSGACKEEEMHFETPQ